MQVNPHQNAAVRSLRHLLILYNQIMAGRKLIWNKTKFSRILSVRATQRSIAQKWHRCHRRYDTSRTRKLWCGYFGAISNRLESVLHRSTFTAEYRKDRKNGLCSHTSNRAMYKKASNLDEAYTFNYLYAVPCRSYPWVVMDMFLTRDNLGKITFLKDGAGARGMRSDA